MAASDPPKSRIDRIVAICLDAGKIQVLTVVALLIALVVLADWATRDISLGILYVLPMLLAATVLPAPAILTLAFACAALRACLDHPQSTMEMIVRFSFSVFSYAICGFFVIAVMRSRREQILRAAAEEQLKVLADSSPAAILTLDAKGTVLAANRAAGDIFGVDAESALRGKPIHPYLPVLSDALGVNGSSAPFRTAAQSLGRRANGDMFLADTWFSTYNAPEGRRLAAIVIDSSEEMREREEHNLKQLAMNSRIMAGAMLHEVRNLCGAISLVYSNVAVGSHGSDDMQALDHLVQGLARIASSELGTQEADPLVAHLEDALNDLRIVIEPAWNESGGRLIWNLPPSIPAVAADTHGLLQVFLNLAQNSHRAVQDAPLRELTISVFAGEERVSIRFADTGCGVKYPDRLFRPFRSGSDSTGLGLYISRSLLRSYGGDLRFEPQETGAAFVVELRCVSRRN
ncbi:MAG TPA: ATP-binding protein [Bryobacteraceae bacterium]|nr:ATP-binding protein [Bryobacteraceae bacterium]